VRWAKAPSPCATIKPPASTPSHTPCDPNLLRGLHGRRLSGMGGRQRDTASHAPPWLLGLPVLDLPPQRRRGRQALGQDVAAGVCDEQRVLKLRRALAVLRGGRPAVRPGHVAPAARVHHRLDRERLPGLHHAQRLRPRRPELCAMRFLKADTPCGRGAVRHEPHTCRCLYRAHGAGHAGAQPQGAARARGPRALLWE